MCLGNASCTNGGKVDDGVQAVFFMLLQPFASTARELAQRLPQSYFNVHLRAKPVLYCR